MWVSPFRYPRIKGYLLLPVAFRSLSRLSSALSAKASTLRSSSLDHPHHQRMMRLVILCLLWFVSCSVTFVTFDVSISSCSFIKRIKIFLIMYAVFKVRISFGFISQMRTKVFYSQLTDKLFFFKIWRPPAFPHRLQCSIIGRLGLNHRVRDGNGCCPQAHRHRNVSYSFF